MEDRGCFSFVDGLKEVEDDIAALVSEAPGRAVGLYEAFLAGCYEKANEVDDSSGSFGMFVGTLLCGWIKVRQAAGAASEETAAACSPGWTRIRSASVSSWRRIWREPSTGPGARPS